MASSTFISIPLKRTNEVDLIKPVSSFIASTYSSDDRPTDTEAIADFNKLRNKAVCQPLDRHESSLEILYRYYDQLVAVEAKLPLTPTQIPVPFKWKDAFDKGSLFFGKASLTLSSGSYEKACVLFNIGALQSQIAAAQSIDTDEELKTAAKLFQQSSGVFNYLKESVLSLVQQEPTVDLMPDTLSALSAVMLAQAQESIYLKAAKDSMKPQIVAKIASQCSDLFQDAARQMSRDTIKGIWEKEWISNLNGKYLAFQSLTQYQQSLVHKEQKEIGAELARLEDAEQKMQQAQKQFESARVYQSEASAISKALELARKDNNFIYHERVPAIKSLSVVQKAAVAKALPVKNPIGTRFKDLFETLVPVAVHQALAAFEVRKAEIVNGEVGRMREQTQLMNGMLASLNLPAAIEDLCNQDALPDSLRDKSSRVRNAGGIRELEKMIGELPGLLNRNKEILDETCRVLTEEKNTDDQLRAEYKERWTRMASEKLTEPLWQEIGKYRGILGTAMGADEVVKQKLENNRRGFELLSKDEAELKSCIPGLGQSAGNKNSQSVLKLKELMKVVDAIRSEREKLETDLKDASFDMTKIFLQALAESGSINEEQISLEKLNEIYGPVRTAVSDSLRKQEQVMQQVQETNVRFCQEKSSDNAGVERESMLKMLAGAHDAYMELRSNLQEGTKFYNDLTPLLVRIQQKVSDFGFARKTEKEDLLKDLQQSTGSRAPPRPPPPNTQAATQQTNAPPVSVPPQQNYPTQQYGNNPFYSSTGTPVPPPRTQATSSAPPSATPNQGYSLPYQPYPGYTGQPALNNPYPSYPYPPSYVGAPAGQVAGQQGATPYPTTTPYLMAAPLAPTGYNPYAAYTQPQPYGQPQPGYQQYSYQ